MNKITANVFRRSDCRLCHSANLDLVLRLAPTPSGDAYAPKEDLSRSGEIFPLEVTLCRDCGQAQLFDIVSPQLLYGKYTYTTSISLGLREHFKNYADEIIRKINPERGSLVMDIGSNDGTLLGFFKARQMRVLGVEPAGEVAARANQAGIETLNLFFSSQTAKKIKDKYGQAAIITANNVFANIDDLDDIVDSVKNLLAPEGVFVMETSYLLDVLEKGLIETFFHEHLSYFSLKPLQAFFSRQGMELIDAMRLPTKGGSLRCIAQLAGGRRKIQPAVSELVFLEERSAIHRKEGFLKFYSKLEKIKEDLIKLLEQLRRQGKKIAGYGASVGVTTLIYYFGISDYLEFLADDNPARHGLYSPGYYIPVLSSQELYQRRPDYVLILAWGYAGPIIKKHEEFLKQGRHFIIPLPEIKVV